MNVDTADLGDLVAEVAALSRKVSCLTGRVTVMGNHVNRIDDSVQKLIRNTEVDAMLRAADMPEPAAAGPLRRAAAKAAQHARPRHLKAVP